MKITITNRDNVDIAFTDLTGSELHNLESQGNSGHCGNIITNNIDYIRLGDIAYTKVAKAIQHDPTILTALKLAYQLRKNCFNEKAIFQLNKLTKENSNVQYRGIGAY